MSGWAARVWESSLRRALARERASLAGVYSWRWTARIALVLRRVAPRQSSSALSRAWSLAEKNKRALSPIASSLSVNLSTRLLHPGHQPPGGRLNIFRPQDSGDDRHRLGPRLKDLGHILLVYSPYCYNGQGDRFPH